MSHWPLQNSKIWLALTFAVFLLTCGGLIIWSDFLPYGTDNNETFSSLVHARNMALNGFFSFYGLTNETASTAPAAQAFLYTHQGNFPRLYAYLLYKAGATSAESQIALTTATVSLGGIVLAFIFTARISTPMFAAIYCGILCTDFLLSLQWMVNTWRAWHLPFFFAPLLLAHLISTDRPRWAYPALTVTFAAAFYFELIFAFLVACTFTVYTATLLWRQPTRLLAVLVCGGLGAVIAASVLSLQIVGQFGWQTYLMDLQYTFLSRNHAPDNEVFRQAVAQFMRDHKIAFWENFATPGQDRLREFVSYTIRAAFLPMTMPIVMLSIPLFGVAVVALLDWFSPRVRFLAILTRPVDGRVCAPAIVLCFVLYAAFVVSSARSLGIVDYRYLIVSGPSMWPFLLICLAIAGTILLALQTPRRTVLIAVSVIGSLAASVIYFATNPLKIDVVSGLALLAGIGAVATLLWKQASTGPTPLLRVFGAIGIMVFVVIATKIHGSAYHAIVSGGQGSHYQDFALHVLNQLGGLTLWHVISIFTGGTAVIACLGQRPGLLRDVAMPRLFPLMIAGLIAYVITFNVGTGYVLTGYLLRLSPFIIYLTALVPAVAFYVLACMCCRASLTRQLILTVPTLAAWLTLWVTVQVNYLVSTEPGRFAPLFRLLADLKGSSVVNNYAIPVSYQTGNWAYYDPLFFTKGEWHDGTTPHVTVSDKRYLWLADGATNPDYKRPQYFVCLLNKRYPEIADKRKAHTCGALPAIADIRGGRQRYFKHREVARDPGDQWSIVALDWGQP